MKSAYANSKEATEPEEKAPEKRKNEKSTPSKSSGSSSAKKSKNIKDYFKWISHTVEFPQKGCSSYYALISLFSSRSFEHFRIVIYYFLRNKIKGALGFFCSQKYQILGKGIVFYILIGKMKLKNFPRFGGLLKNEIFLEK